MGYVRYEVDGAVRIGWRESGRTRRIAASSLIDALLSELMPEPDAHLETELTLLPPIDCRAKILCVALNFVDHAKEANQPVPESPIIFLKAQEAMIAAGDVIEARQHITQLDYEGEIAVVIGKGGYSIPKDAAWDHVAGVTPFNDVSARNLFKVQAGDALHLDWFSGKCLERSTPIGPEITPVAAVLNDLKAKSTRVRTLVNGELRQDAPISDMIFDIPTLIAFASSRISLSPGDVIATGTPPGVGAGTGRFLNKGDTVQIEITGLPLLENRIG